MLLSLQNELLFILFALKMEVVGRERLVAEGVGALKLRPDCRILLVGNWSGGYVCLDLPCFS